MRRVEFRGRVHYLEQTNRNTANARFEAGGNTRKAEQLESAAVRPELRSKGYLRGKDGELRSKEYVREHPRLLLD